MHNHHTKGFALLCTNYSAYLMGITVININAYVGGEGLVWVRGYSMCTCVRAQTLDKAGHRLYIAHLSGLNACIICAGCCSMQCNCAEGLHFSAFQVEQVMDTETTLHAVSLIVPLHE